MAEYPVLWRDLDANKHLKNTAYFEYTLLVAELQSYEKFTYSYKSRFWSCYS